MKSNPTPVLALAAAVILSAVSARAAAAAPLYVEMEALNFTDRYCSSCHNDVDKEGGLDLSTLKYTPSDPANFQTWVKVYDRVQAGEMPPKEKKRPNPTDAANFVKGVATSLIASEQQITAIEGRSTQRRLNRSEYENALRDLLHAPWVMIKEQLPEDGEAFKFNKVTEALDVSHVHMLRYMAAADFAMRQAMTVQFNHIPTTTTRYYAREHVAYGAGDSNPDRGRFPVFNSQPADPDVLSRKAPLTVGAADPVVREQEAMAWIASNYITGFGSGWSGFRAPVAGKYRLTFSGYTVWVGPYGTRTPTVSFIGKTPKGGDPRARAILPPEWHRPNAWDVSMGRRNEPISVYARGGGAARLLGGFDITPEPSVSTLGVLWMGANETLITDATRFFRSRPTGVPDGYTNPLARRDGMPGVAFRWMEVEGPIYDESSTDGYRLLFGDLPMTQVAAGVPGVALDIVRDTAAGPAGGGRGRAGRGAPAAQGAPAAPAAAAAQAALDAAADPAAAPAAAAPAAQAGRRGGRGGRGGPGGDATMIEVVSANPQQDSERLLRGFMARAYRRPVQEEDVKIFLDVIKDRMTAGLGFAGSMLAGYTAVLSSPEFVYLQEKPGRLEDNALATRLALFLWNSEPDAALKARAAKAELHRPEILKAETARMLADPKASRFVEAFLDYWLEIRRIEDTTPSTTLYNDYYLDDALREAAVTETRMFFTELLQKDLPARNIVDSDFTYLNGRLAEHYGMPGIEGYASRRVTLPANSVRGGFMTQASVLKVTANGTTSSPVLRGKWIMERIIGFEMPPPPAAVPAVEPDIRGAVTIRQQLDKHRADESCAICHRKIDPPGFALESFDVMGAFRDRYRATSVDVPAEDGFGKNGWPFAFHYAQPVDPSGQLPDGRSFKDVRDLKKLLLADEAQIARNLVRQLSVYATGAPIRFSDRAKVEQIMQATKGSQYGVRSIVTQLIQSDLFLNK